MQREHPKIGYKVVRTSDPKYKKVIAKLFISNKPAKFLGTHWCCSECFVKEYYIYLNNKILPAPETISHTFSLFGYSSDIIYIKNCIVKSKKPIDIKNPRDFNGIHFFENISDITPSMLK